jgi:TonB family protein
MPNADDLAEYYPEAAMAQKLVGKAVTRCLIRANGTLYDCNILSETPPGYGFARASIAVMRLYKMRPRTVNGEPVEGYSVDIPLTWILPMPAAADTASSPARQGPVYTGPVAVASLPGPRPTPPPRPLFIANPDWERTPTPEELGQVYPAAALAAGKSGHTRITCSVQANGTLYNCTLSEETPTGLGFGRAALISARYFKMRPKTVDGVPITGALVSVPMRWMPPQ